uniref:Recombination activating protein 2 n=1 Tax=Echinococcus granulosus TaxID=6210 RepID=U6J1B3_ECHGR|nr:hypothetical protein EgrG_002018500 [Echinococcus granulosus]CDS16234.1 hypothetical protein EgrG_002018600 [Echinococcus granulosus]
MQPYLSIGKRLLSVASTTFLFKLPHQKTPVETDGCDWSFSAVQIHLNSEPGLEMSSNQLCPIACGEGAMVVACYFNVDEYIITVGNVLKV